MSKLIFEMKGDGSRWETKLTEIFGESFAKQCVIEADATANMHSAKAIVLNFNKNKEVIKTLKEHQQVLSAYLIDNKKITTTLR